MDKLQSMDSVSLKVEQKIFNLKTDDSKNRHIKIIEKHKSGINQISVDFEGAFGLEVN